MAKPRTIPIPRRLEDLLDGDEKLSAGVQSVLAQYSEWLKDSKPLFFPDYTNHGPQHLADVLAASDELVPDEAFGLLTAQDAAALIVAVLLHDVALHMTIPGFSRLAKGQTSLTPLADFGDEAWPTLWERFRTEVARLSEAQLNRLFNETTPVPAPSLDDWDWTKKQDRLAGEFIRRHHARLAHQIALHGFPGAKQEEFELGALLPRPITDVAGLIARSHGMALRPCVDYLQREHFNRIDPAGVHAVFLMCVLRVADYLQIESGRAPMVQLQMDFLRSPVSIEEWQKHHSVGQLTRDEADPEAWRVLILPEKLDSARVYLAMRSLLDSIQKELDDSWAILGEVYGRQRDTHRPLYLLGLTIRRLRSNLDDPNLIRKLSFEPVGLQFRSADAKLFKLLIEPLYGGNADIGVRELLQNAVDAVRELDAYCQRRQKPKGDLELPDQSEEVVVELVTNAEGVKCLVVRDRGIGMTLEVIRDYFLRVGASYRESAAYKYEFTAKDGASTVLRTGYFGVGALAAFLVGERIHVSTRHVTSAEGLQFSASIETEVIEVSRVKRPVGTTITIPLHERLVKKGWTPQLRHYLEKPSVGGVVDRPKEFYPDAHDDPPPRWQRLRKPSRPVVMWARGLRQDYVERVTHNGFLVEHGDQQPRPVWAERFYGLKLSCPLLHILDFEGNQRTPYLNLARTEFLLDRFEPAPELYADMLRDYLAYLIVNTPGDGLSPTLNPPSEYRYVDLYLTRLHLSVAGLTEGIRGRSWVYTKQGVALFDGENLAELGIKTLLLIQDSELLPIVQEDASVAILMPESPLPYWQHSSTDTKAGDSLLYPRFGLETPPAGLTVVGSSWFHLERWDEESQSVEAKLKSTSRNLAGSDPGEAPGAKELRAYLGKVHSLPARDRALRPVFAWSLGPPGQKEPGLDDIDGLMRSIARSAAPSPGPSPLAAVWRKFIRQPAIPYDRELRQKTLAHAYSELSHYIRAWQELLAETKSPA